MTAISMRHAGMKHAPKPAAILNGAAALTLCFGFAAPVFAQTFNAPDGCNLDMTVQVRSCSVYQIYQCEADPEGYQRSAIYDDEGILSTSIIDDETRWIETVGVREGAVERLAEDARDDASFSELLKTGLDSYDFETELSVMDGNLRHVGFDRLTGETTTIDGVELEIVEFELTTYAPNGVAVVERSGQQYISREQGRFWGGVETSTDISGETLETDDSPVTFSFPGDAGFGQTTPQYGCQERLVSFEGY